MCVDILPVYLFTMYVPGAHRDQRRASDPQKLELKMVASHPVSAEVAACLLKEQFCALNCGAISPAPNSFF